MKTLEIELPWPDRALSPNARLHPLAKARAFKAAKARAYVLTKGALHGDMPKLRDGSRMNLRLVVYPASRRRRDEDNLLASCKALLDGIAAAIGIDDSLFHFREQDWREPTKPGRLSVILDWVAE